MWKCPNGCKIAEVIASLPTEIDSDNECQVMCDALTGKATNHFWDGIRGVPDEWQKMAEADEQPSCPECQNECDWVTLAQLYTAELVKRIIAKPEDYMDTVETAPALAHKMLEKIKAGSGVSLNANPSLKAACRKIGITTFAGLKEHLQNE